MRSKIITSPLAFGSPPTTPTTGPSSGASRASRAHRDISDITEDLTIQKEVEKLAQEADDDPPLILDWMPDNVQRFINRIPAVGPPPFPIPLPLTPHSFMVAVVAHLRAVAPGPAPLGTVCLPGSQLEYSRLLLEAAALEHDPWFAAVAAAAPGVGAPLEPGPLSPLANVYILSPTGQLMGGFMGRAQVPINLWQ